MALISLAVAGVSAALVVAFSGSTKNIIRSNQAYLLEEAFEGVQAIARGDWNELYEPMGTQNRGTNFRYGIVLSTDKWALNGGGPTFSQTISFNSVNFERHIIIEEVCRTLEFGAGDLSAVGPCTPANNNDPTTLRVTVEVAALGTGVVTANQSRYISRHQNALLQITSFSGYTLSGNISTTGGIHRTTNGDDASTATSTTIDLGSRVSPIQIRWEGTI